MENRHDHNISEAELLVRNSRGDSSIGVQCREGAHNAVLGRSHGERDPQWQTGMKNIEILEVFSGLEVPNHRPGCSPRSPTSLSAIYK